MQQISFSKKSVTPITVAKGIDFEECCIVFIHHKTDEVTRYHHSIIQKMNPYRCVAIHDGQEGLPGSINVPSTGEWAKESKWAGADLPLYNWFKRTTVRAKRYIIMEWDTLATKPVRDFYGPLWDEDAVSADVVGLHRTWCLFKQVPKMPAALQPFAMGIAPFGLLLLSHRCLNAVCNSNIPHDIQNELRLGTLINANGFKITKHPTALETIDFRPLYMPTNPPANIYHPVKIITGPPLPTSQPFKKLTGTPLPLQK